MSVIVKLKDIVDEMEFQIDEYHIYLNTFTGEIVRLSSEDLYAAEEEEPFDQLPEWQQEMRMLASEVVENFDNYLELPTKFDIHEYQIMESFCYTVSDQHKQHSLLSAIKGRGAFRRFKDWVIKLDMEEQWYSYRKECFTQIAKEWCEENQIKYAE